MMNSQREFHTDAGENRIKVLAEFDRNNDLDDVTVWLIHDDTEAKLEIEDVYIDVQGKLTPLTQIVVQEAINRGPDNA